MLDPKSLDHIETVVARHEAHERKIRENPNRSELHVDKFEMGIILMLARAQLDAYRRKPRGA